MSPLPEPAGWLVYILMGLVVALLVSAAISYVLGRFVAYADGPTPDEQAEDERGLDSVRARLAELRDEPPADAPRPWSPAP